MTILSALKRLWARARAPKPDPVPAQRKELEYFRTTAGGLGFFYTQNGETKAHLGPSGGARNAGLEHADLPLVKVNYVAVPGIDEDIIRKLNEMGEVKR